MTDEKEKPITLKYTEEEILQEINDLEKDEDLLLFLKVNQGTRKYSKLQQLYNVMEELKKPKP